MEAKMATDDRHGVQVLFAPNALPVLDLFRAFGSADEVYGVEVFDRLEASLSGLVEGEVAKTIVSDVLLFSFALRRKRRIPVMFRPVSSRVGTKDEYSLMTLISAAGDVDQDLSRAAISALEIQEADPLVSLASDISRGLKALPFKTAFLDAKVFTAIVGLPLQVSKAGRNGLGGGYSKFNFNFKN